MQKLTDMPKVLTAQLYKDMISQSEPVLSFELNSKNIEDPSLTWKLPMHPGRDLHRDYWYDIGCMHRHLLL